MAVQLTVFVRVATENPGIDWLYFIIGLVTYSMLLIYAGFIIGEER